MNLLSYISPHNALTQDYELYFQFNIQHFNHLRSEQTQNINLISTFKIQIAGSIFVEMANGNNQ